MLELGAGVGLLGLKCLRLNKFKRYIFTDFHELGNQNIFFFISFVLKQDQTNWTNIVLKQLEKNVLYNYDKRYVHLENENDEGIDQLIFIEKLDWTDHESFSLFSKESNKKIDLILATGINSFFYDMILNIMI